jgi:4'-phosphopantetheinyl transferase
MSAGSATSGTPLDPLATGADVWWLRESDVEAFATAVDADRVLAADEHERHDRMRQAGARRRYLGARLISRVGLSHYVGTPPESWRFEKGEFGRPEISGETYGLDFNITHTDGMIAMVVARHRRCGLDIEHRPIRPEAAKLAPRVLSPVELAFVRLLPGELRRCLFADLWVAKEAYTKALGMGLCRPFETFGTRRKDDGTIELVDPTLPEAERIRWQMEVFRVADWLSAGVAIQKLPGETSRVPLWLHDARVELTDTGGDPLDLGADDLSASGQAGT